MSEEENSNHIVIEVVNNDGYLKLTKFRNPQAIWQNNDYPDEYVFKDVDYINIFQLIQQNKQLKEEMKVLFEENNNKEQVIIKYQDNWNKLKNIAKSQSGFKLKCHYESLWFEVDELLNKMQELEKGDSNE